MSQREVERAGVIAEVAAGRMRQRQAAKLLGLSCRQVKRLARAWRVEGAAGLRSRRRGRPGNRRHSDRLRKQVLTLAAERYAGFGPTLLGIWSATTRSRCVSRRCASGSSKRACGSPAPNATRCTAPAVRASAS